VAIFPRVFIAIATIGIGAAIATPSIAATDGHSIPWASLGVIRPILTQPAGWGSPIAAQPSSDTTGWCSKKGVEVASGSSRTTLVPDNTVGIMLKSSHLGMVGLPGSSKVVVACDAVALDPNHPDTVYASFEASKGGSIPPLYDIALVTSNMGKSWTFVPPPRGYSLTDFAGFVVRLSSVEFLFSHNIFFPLKQGQSITLVAATSTTGGLSWTDARLGCSTSDMCFIFGPQAPQGACGMSEWQQSVLFGGTGASTSTPKWRAAGAVTSVSQCGSQQLIATNSGTEFLIDRSSQNPLLYTRSGTNWTSISLPKMDGKPVGGTFASFGQVMTIAANGDLVAVAGSPLQTAEHLEILKPDSSAWCAANAPLPTATKQDPVAAMQSSGLKLVVTFLSPVRTNRGSATSALNFPLSNLHCLT
jgi:hypothetical protein